MVGCMFSQHANKNSTTRTNTNTLPLKSKLKNNAFVLQTAQNSGGAHSYFQGAL